MLNNSERELMARIAKENPDADYIFRKLEEEQRELLSLASHEIRNPLTLISSSLQLIEQNHPETTNFRFWNQVKEDIHSLSALLDNISLFTNAHSLHMEIVDLNQLAASVVQSFLPEFEQRALHIHLNSCEKAPYIPADPIRLRQVLVNLIKNAMEALAPGGSTWVTLICSPDTISVAVRDNGCGIPEEYQEYIFLPFKTFKPQGTGLGLPLCQQVLSAHGGTLTFQSEKDAGAVFTMTLPIVS